MTTETMPKELSEWLTKYPNIEATHDPRTDAVCYDFKCKDCKQELAIRSIQTEAATFDYYDGFANRKFQMCDCDWYLECGCEDTETKDTVWKYKVYDAPESYEVNW